MATEHGQSPLVWALASYRAGESGQIRALAEALAWPFRWVELAYRPKGALQQLMRGVGLQGIAVDRCDGFGPPWPDVLISGGLRNEPVARWVKRASGGRTQLVFLGRSWAALEHFDLVITTPQYRLPDVTNVLHNVTTLHGVSATRLAAAGEALEPRVVHCPSPRIGVLLGGDSGPYPFRRRAAALLGRLANAKAEAASGSLLVTTSARTHPGAIRAFEGALTVPSFVYRWTENAGDNPYLGLLGMADELVVTGDSIAMLSEAVGTAKPVHIFDLDVRRHGERSEFTFKTMLYRGLMRRGPKRLSRDISIVQERLVGEGRAVWLGEPWQGPSSPVDVDESMARAVTRVQELVSFHGHHERSGSPPGRNNASGEKGRSKRKDIGDTDH